MLYADVILPLSLAGQFTYSVPETMQSSIRVGCRVIVQFGRKKFYTALVSNLYEELEQIASTKEITALLDVLPIVTTHQLEFWEWIAEYYMCNLGDVYRAALPAALKLESETYVLSNPDFVAEKKMKPSEMKVFHYLSDEEPVRISDLSHKTGISNVLPIVKALVDCQAAILSETLKRGYKPKVQQAVRLKQQFDEAQLSSLLDSLQKVPKQYKLLLSFIEQDLSDGFVLKKELLERNSLSSSVLDSLVKKEIFEIYNHQIARNVVYDSPLSEAHSLNDAQQEAFNRIDESFQEKNVTLLYGVTSSGKTEVYIQLIKKYIDAGQQVLYLLPEIALTTQITNRLRAIFGNKVAVYHSRFNDNERAETWNRLLNDDECCVVLGARSSIFLPFTRLGLIIVDEEHESSYKQQDPAPRYHARNAAIMMGAISGAKILLGSATPSLESYYNTVQGRYGLVQLTERYKNIPLPAIEVVNTKELRRKKLMKSVLSPPLLGAISEALERREQVILFQNRRGFASLLSCKTCSWTKKCDNCDVSLTYHKGQGAMVCHYCGATYPIPEICPECQTPTLEIQGYGTERIEEEIKFEFPEARIARMDLDTTRSKQAYEHIIGDFEDAKTDILIGTQMVSKGLDFDNVAVVGIINADNMLNYPDFRAHERAYQLMMQVSGRAGRKNKQGLVILQTSDPLNPVIACVCLKNSQSFYESQAHERELFHYPPYYRLIEVVMRAKDFKILDKAAKLFAGMLRQPFTDRVLGPSQPPVSRIQSLYIRKILLKFEVHASTSKVREIIGMYHAQALRDSLFKQVLIHYDVDPV